MARANAESTVTMKIPLLNGSNYHSWKFKAEMVLKEKGLWKYVNGTAVLRNNATVNERQRFADDADKALATICLNVDDNQQMYVQNAADAEDAWNRLSQQYERRTLANKLFLRRKFITLQMDEKDDMRQHINKLQSLATQLASIGAAVSDEDMVTTLLCSLPESYESLITALESRDVNDLTIQFVTGRLLHEAEKREQKATKERSRGDEKEEQAMYGRAKRGGRSGFRGNQHQSRDKSNGQGQNKSL